MSNQRTPLANKRRNRNMHKNANVRLMLAMLIAVSVTGCATQSEPTLPVVVPRVQLTPLPQSIKQIDSTDSQPYLTKVSNWLSKVEALLSGETPK